MTNEEAFVFAKKNPNKRGEVIRFIDDSGRAYKWALRFPEDKDKVIQFVTVSDHAYMLAVHFAEYQDEMKQRSGAISKRKGYWYEQ